MVLMDKIKIKSRLKKQSLDNSRKLAYTTQLFVQEEFLRRLSLRKKKEDFILTGLYSIYGRNQFPQKISIPLEFQLKNQDNLFTFIQEQLEKIIKFEVTETVLFTLDYVKEKAEDIDQNKIFQAQIIGQIQEVKAPFIIKFYIGEDKIKAKEVTYPVQIDGFLPPTVYSNRLEVIVAESLVRILKNKELQDSFYDLYNIWYVATNFSVNGRRIEEQLEIYKENEEHWFQQEDFHKVFQVNKLRQFQIKWKQFCNVLGEKETDFSQTVQLAEAFLGTIWKSVFDDIVFFGDWMPELKRYIG